MYVCLVEVFRRYLRTTKGSSLVSFNQASHEQAPENLCLNYSSGTVRCCHSLSTYLRFKMARTPALAGTLLALLLVTNVHAAFVAPKADRQVYQTSTRSPPAGGPPVTVHPPSTGGSACENAKKGCLAAAKKNAGTSGAAKMISECKKVRSCKQTCRMVKQEAKSVCRSEKDICKKECKKLHGTWNKHYRKCKRGCRSDKRVCKKEAVADKKECKSECRDTWLTPACKAARTKVLVSVLKTVRSCASMVSCINTSP